LYSQLAAADSRPTGAADTKMSSKPAVEVVDAIPYDPYDQ
jgi:hypothetical protein